MVCLLCFFSTVCLLTDYRSTCYSTRTPGRGRTRVQCTRTRNPRQWSVKLSKLGYWTTSPTRYPTTVKYSWRCTTNLGTVSCLSNLARIRRTKSLKSGFSRQKKSISLELLKITKITWLMLKFLISLLVQLYL